MKRLMVLGLMLLALGGCNDEKSARRILEQEGYTAIEFTGYRWFLCGENDQYHTGFRAMKNNHSASGAVCEGLLFKGSTIRFD